LNVLAFPPIAEGRTAEIYSWDDGYILKLYRDWCPRDWVDYEAWIARAVHEAGVPSPRAGEIVEVDGRRGLIYERLVGISMLQDMNARPWTLWKHARSLAELQAEIHQKSIPGLPSYKERLRHDIRQTSHLTEDQRRKVFSMLGELPDEQNLCHGDYHPANIFLTQQGPVVIDWMTACSGNPWADVARTNLILGIGAKAAGKQVSPFLRMAISIYHRTYLNHYRILHPGSTKELSRWSPVIAAARLNENINPERQALIRIVEQG
jgi:uncharacterized protein (TIGR02172 family)